MDAPDAGTHLLGLGSHLRAWMLERVRADGRVALLGHEAESSAALAAVGCAVLEVELDAGAPPSSGGAPPAEVLEALTRFAPTHVVLPLRGVWPLETWLGALRRAVPDAELLFGFWNTASASQLVATLVGRRSG